MLNSRPSLNPFLFRFCFIFLFRGGRLVPIALTRLGFSQAVHREASKDHDLIKPSLISVVVSLVVAVVFSVPIIGVALTIGDGTLGRALLFAFGALLIFAQYIVSYLFAGMTVYLIYGRPGRGRGRRTDGQSLGDGVAGNGTSWTWRTWP